MISRRNIRVKVLQTLYSLERQEEKPRPAEAGKLLTKRFDQSRELLAYLIHFITEVARFSETDAKNKASKHLPSKQDLEVSTRIAGNLLLWKILEHPSYQLAEKEWKPQLKDDRELIKRIYQELTATEKYQEYIALQSRDKKDEKEILEFILSDLMLPNEHFTSFIEEEFSNWEDDAEMVSLLTVGFLNKPSGLELQELMTNDKKKFAEDLLLASLEKKELALEYIIPKLKNWDPERIAILDMLLMRMGVCEFLFFETIPPKVTINEYIDLAKEYSTEQSGHFINGILDNIHKDLVQSNKMHKIAFK